MADPIVAYLPALSQALGAGNITQTPQAGAGTPLQRALVAGATPLPAPTGAQLQAQFNAQALPITPAAPVAAAPANIAAAPANIAAPTPAATPAAAAVPAAVPAAIPAAVPQPIAADAAAATAADTRVRAAIPSFPGVAGTPADSGVQTFRGDAATPAPAAQVGSFRDPSGSISAGFDRQQAYGDHFMNEALNYIQGGSNIFEQATRGRAIGNILHAVAGSNNEGAVQGQGVDALNSSIAGLSGASLGAQSQMYNADTNQAINTARNATDMQVERTRIAATPVPIGNTSGVNSLGLPYNQTNYGQNSFAPGSAMPTMQPITPVREAPKPTIVEGSTGVRNGKAVVYRQGQWVNTQ